VRELVNRVQNLRKDLDLGYTQRIALSVNGAAGVVDAVREHQKFVSGETLAVEVVLGRNVGEARPFEVDGHEVELGIELR
jgi:isoleucyl-tRNA synthetase